MKNIIKLIS